MSEWLLLWVLFTYRGSNNQQRTFDLPLTFDGVDHISSSTGEKLSKLLNQRPFGNLLLFYLITEVIKVSRRALLAILLYVSVGQRIWKKSGTFVAGKKYINGSWNSSPPGMHIIVHWPQVILIVDISLTFDAHRWRHNSSTSDGATLILLVTACCVASPSNTLLSSPLPTSCVINEISLITTLLLISPQFYYFGAHR